MDSTNRSSQPVASAVGKSKNLTDMSSSSQTSMDTRFIKGMTNQSGKKALSKTITFEQSAANKEGVLSFFKGFEIPRSILNRLVHGEYPNDRRFYLRPFKGVKMQALRSYLAGEKSKQGRSDENKQTIDKGVQAARIIQAHLTATEIRKEEGAVVKGKGKGLVVSIQSWIGVGKSGDEQQKGDTNLGKLNARLKKQYGSGSTVTEEELKMSKAELVNNLRAAAVVCLAEDTEVSESSSASNASLSTSSESRSTSIGEEETEPDSVGSLAEANGNTGGSAVSAKKSGEVEDAAPVELEAEKQKKELVKRKVKLISAGIERKIEGKRPLKSMIEMHLRIGENDYTSVWNALSGDQKEAVVGILGKGNRIISLLIEEHADRFLEKIRGGDFNRNVGGLGQALRIQIDLDGLSNEDVMGKILEKANESDKAALKKIAKRDGALNSLLLSCGFLQS